jgi:hypothetical protein
MQAEYQNQQQSIVRRKYRNIYFIISLILALESRAKKQ